MADPLGMVDPPKHGSALRTGGRPVGCAGIVLGSLVLIAGAAGCAPVLTTFEQPNAPGAEVVNRTCPPTPDVLLFRKEGVVAAVSMKRQPIGRTTFYLSFEIPSDRSVRLLEPTLGVSIARGDRLRSNLSCIWGPRRQSVHPESLMTGRANHWGYRTTTGYGVTRHDFYLFAAEVATDLEGTFTLTLPKVLLNDRLWELPPVLFLRVHRWIIMPFNC